MKTIRYWTKLLLWSHLFVCLVWLYLYEATSNPPIWMIHAYLWSILVVQFTWGVTVGLMVGPSRRRRGWLWLSLLTIFMPLSVIGLLIRLIFHFLGMWYALGYLAAFTAGLACETFGGVLLGAKLHSHWRRDEFLD